MGINKEELQEIMKTLLSEKSTNERKVVIDFIKQYSVWIWIFIFGTIASIAIAGLSEIWSGLLVWGIGGIILSIAFGNSVYENERLKKKMIT